LQKETRLLLRLLFSSSSGVANLTIGPSGALSHLRKIGTVKDGRRNALFSDVGLLGGVDGLVAIVAPAAFNETAMLPFGALRSFLNMVGNHALKLSAMGACQLDPSTT